MLLGTAYGSVSSCKMQIICIEDQFLIAYKAGVTIDQRRQNLQAYSQRRVGLSNCPTHNQTDVESGYLWSWRKKWSEEFQ